MDNDLTANRDSTGHATAKDGTVASLVRVGEAVVAVKSVWEDFSALLGTALRKVLVEYPPLLHDCLPMMAEKGWYFDARMGFSEPLTYREAFASGDPAQIATAEAELAAHFAKWTDEMEAVACTEFPARAHILRAAFQAHRDGKYVLSIPVLLAQVDGICLEAMGGHLFMRRNKQPGTAIYATAEHLDPWTRALASPLAVIGAVNRSREDRPADFIGLNRHQVLHGEVTDYGTEINSLKAISLLNYVGQTLARANETEGRSAGSAGTLEK